MRAPAAADEPDDRGPTNSETSFERLSRILAQTDQITKTMATIERATSSPLFAINQKALIPSFSDTTLAALEKAYFGHTDFTRTLGAISAINTGFSGILDAVNGKSITERLGLSGEAARVAETIGRVAMNQDIIGSAFSNLESTRALASFSNLQTSSLGFLNAAIQGSWARSEDLLGSASDAWARLGLENEPQDDPQVKIETVETKFEIPNDGQVIAVNAAPKGIIAVAVNQAVKILQMIAADPETRYNLKPRELEELTQEILMRLGYVDVELTPPSGDGGIDVYGSLKTPMGLIKTGWECKAYAPHRLVPPKEVRALHGVAQDQRLAHSTLLTTNRFGPASEQFAAQNENTLSLADGTMLVSFVRQVVYLNQ